MALAHALLPDAVVGPAALKLVGPQAPAPLRGMAARGLAPVPPRDAIVALYQLWVGEDAALGETAAKTVESIAKGMISSALQDAELPVGVIDFLARKLVTDEATLELIVRHPNTHGETLIGVARVCSVSICDILAANQRRWFETPAIVEALYQNPNCRMSVTHAMLELAIRQGIELNLPNIEEIRETLGDGAAAEPTRDAMFSEIASGRVGAAQTRVVDKMRRAGPHDAIDDLDGLDDLDNFDEFEIPSNPEESMSLPLDAREQETASSSQGRGTSPGDGFVIAQLRPMEKIRLALLGTAAERAVLIRDSNKTVAVSAIKSPKVRADEATAYAASPTMHLEVIRHIARRRDWIKLYGIKLNLVLNPKCPMSTAMSLLTHLHAHDIRKVARSRNIPNAVCMAAKRRMEQKR